MNENLQNYLVYYLEKQRNNTIYRFGFIYKKRKEMISLTSI